MGCLQAFLFKMDVHLDVWRVEIPLKMLLHRKSAHWKCWKTLRGNAKKIFFYIYIYYIPQIISLQHFLLFWAFFCLDGKRTDSVSNSPTFARIGMCVLQPSAPFQGEQFMFSSCYRFLWKKTLQFFCRLLNSLANYLQT